MNKANGGTLDNDPLTSSRSLAASNNQYRGSLTPFGLPEVLPFTIKTNIFYYLRSQAHAEAKTAQQYRSTPLEAD
jgi:hypothetical protein